MPPEAASKAAPCRLLELPDPCLLAVLQGCCAEQPPRSLCSAARAHSRLHQAAVAALTSIRAVLPPRHPVQTLQPQTQQQQRRLDSLLLYLEKHGQRVDSIMVDFRLEHHAASAQLRELPRTLQHLHSLTLCGLELQLQPGDGAGGVVWQGLPLTRLCLEECMLLDGEDIHTFEEGVEGLAAALKLLPGLEHLSIRHVDSSGNIHICCRTGVLAGLQSLTHLHLAGCETGDSENSMRWLQGLTRLRDLRLAFVYPTPTVAASTLSCLQALTRLELRGQCVEFEPAVLAGRPHLQHLVLQDVWFSGNDAAGVAALLQQLSQLLQLTHLQWLQDRDEANPAAPIAPAAAYAALTASTQLQCLDITSSTVPRGVWQHMFPPGRQLPHLTELQLGYVTHPDGPAPAPECSMLVSCCPALQVLALSELQYSPLQLAPLSGLHALQDLWLTRNRCPEEPSETLGWLFQLTGLRRLGLSDPAANEDCCVFLRLTQLRQLTSVYYCAPHLFRAYPSDIRYEIKGPHDMPVWRWLLWRQQRHSDPEVVRHAAAALAAE